MNTIIKFFVVGLTVSLFSCTNNMGDIMSSADIEALQAMNTSYDSSIEANNALADYINTTGITEDETCFYYDSIFHHENDEFELYHMMYSHSNEGDDHGTNDWMMGSGWMNGNMMGGNMNAGNTMDSHFNINNCTANNLNLMDSLLDVHDMYHPGN